MTFKFPKFKDQRFDIEGATILLTLAGSRSYGTEMANSDYDYKGVLVPPKKELLSPFSNFEQVMWKGDGKTGRVSEIAGTAESDEEGTIYGLNKFVKLAARCNPNIIEALYVEEMHIMRMSPEGKLLRDNRDLFLSAHAANTFAGYASSQLNRIKTHKRWIDNPEPTNSQYREWIKSRNVSRSQLESLYGFDSKHAAHLVRLLRMGLEVLQTGKVNVFRPDHKELLGIRNGSMTYKELIKWADEKRDELFEVVNSGKISVPKEPDYKAIEKLVEEIYFSAWNKEL